MFGALQLNGWNEIGPRLGCACKQPERIGRLRTRSEDKTAAAKLIEASGLEIERHVGHDLLAGSVENPQDSIGAPGHVEQLTTLGILERLNGNGIRDSRQREGLKTVVAKSYGLYLGGSGIQRVEGLTITRKGHGLRVGHGNQGRELSTGRLVNGTIVTADADDDLLAGGVDRNGAERSAEGRNIDYWSSERGAGKARNRLEPVSGTGI